MALITDGRFSGATRGFCIGHVGPEAADGGPIALVEDGDIIAIDAEAGTIELEVAEDVLAERRKALAAARPRLPRRRAVALCAERRPGLPGRGDASRRARPKPMSMRISSALAPCCCWRRCAAGAARALRRGPAARSGGDNVIECALRGAGSFARDCTVERVAGGRRTRSSSCAIPTAASAASRCSTTATASRGRWRRAGAESSWREGGIEVAVGADRYRFPATMLGR